MTTQRLQRAQSRTANGGSLKRMVGTHRPATLKEMGIITDEDYHNYVNDCMAGHASIYHRKEKTRRPVRPNAEVRDGGPVASGITRGATPPFSAPTG